MGILGPMSGMVPEPQFSGSQDVGRKRSRDAQVFSQKELQEKLAGELAKQKFGEIQENEKVSPKEIRINLSQTSTSTINSKNQLQEKTSLVFEDKISSPIKQKEAELAEIKKQARPKVTINLSENQGPKKVRVESALDKLTKETHVELQIFSKREQMINDIVTKGWDGFDKTLKKFQEQSVDDKKSATKKFEETTNKALKSDNPFKKSAKAMEGDIKNEVNDFKIVYLNSADIIKEVSLRKQQGSEHGSLGEKQIAFLRMKKDEIDKLSEDKRPSKTVLSYIDGQMNKMIKHFESES